MYYRDDLDPELSSCSSSLLVFKMMAVPALGAVNEAIQFIEVLPIVNSNDYEGDLLLRKYFQYEL